MAVDTRGSHFRLDLIPSLFDSPTFECATAIVALSYGLKRLWAIDLELRAHRERQRTRLREAQAEAALTGSERQPHADLGSAAATLEDVDAVGERRDQRHSQS